MAIGAFDLDVEEGNALPDMFPVVGMKQRGAHVRTNFGWQEFDYDVRNIVRDQHNVVLIRSRMVMFEGADETESDEESNHEDKRTLQWWVPDEIIGTDLSLSLGGSEDADGAGWDQFEVNQRLFGVAGTTDYDETIYTTVIDKSHPEYNKRSAEADRKAREIKESSAYSSHAAEERIKDNLTVDNSGFDEEDIYRGVQGQDFPQFAPSGRPEKYMPPGRRRVNTQQPAASGTGSNTWSSIEAYYHSNESLSASPPRQPYTSRHPSPSWPVPPEGISETFGLFTVKALDQGKAKKKQLVIQQEATGIEVFKVNSRLPGQVRSGCSYCDVPLCKTRNCFKEWHSQKG
jgi:hypothetical protein